ncbi:hypothetical protein TNCV_5065131 [Trichonephila clavipes]|nr:hypothetical protein TNCV_5065131 [Trichonephila clavipes]
MAGRNHLHGFTRERIIRILKEGCCLTGVAEEFGINRNVVSRAWKAFQTISTPLRKQKPSLRWPIRPPSLVDEYRSPPVIIHPSEVGLSVSSGKAYRRLLSMWSCRQGKPYAERAD